MELKCDWSDRRDVMAYFGNLASPVIYPHFTATGAIPESLACVPFGNKMDVAGGLAVYDCAIITVGFSNKIDSTELCVESLEPTAEFRTLDPSEFTWSDETSLRPEEAPGHLLQMLTYTVEFPYVTTLPTGFLSHVGKVNDAGFDAWTLGMTFPKETLLYTPTQLTRNINTTGVGAWSIGMSMIYQPAGWNRYWRQKVTAYDVILDSQGEEYKNYPLADFERLRIPT